MLLNLAWAATSILLPQVLAHPLRARGDPTVVFITQTQTVQTTQTVTDHTTQTDIVLETAYVLDSLPPCLSLATGSPSTFEIVPIASATPTSAVVNYAAAGTSTMTTGAATATSVVAANAGPGATGITTGPGVATPTGGFSGSTSNSSPDDSATTLYPSVPPGINTGDMQHLTPRDNGSFYLISDGKTDSPFIFAEINATFTFPAVILPHTAYVNVSCMANGLELIFSNATAFEYAQQYWKGQFLLITDTLGCSAAQDGQHTFWLVSSVSFGESSLTVIVYAQEVATEDAVGQVDLVWGTSNPTNSGGDDTGIVTLPGTIGNSSTGVVGTTSNTSCADFPDTYLGLPTACPGSDFDVTLDYEIGFFDFTDDADASALDSDLDSFIPDVPDNSTLTKRAIKRGKPKPAQKQKTQPPKTPPKQSPPKAAPPASVQKTNQVAVQQKAQVNAKQGASKVVAAEKAAPAANKVATAGDATANAIKTENAAKAANGLLAAGGKVLEGIKTATDALADLSVGPVSLPLTYGPGDSYSIYQQDINKEDGSTGTVALNCINCGTTGTATVQGAISFKPGAGGLLKAQVSIAGDIAARLQLQLHSDAAITTQQNKTIMTYKVPGASINVGKYVTASLAVTLGANAAIDLKGAVDATTGVTISVSGLNANLDLVDRAKSAVTGFNPTYSTSLTATGSAASTIGLSLPMDISVGLDFLSGTLVSSVIPRQEVALRNSPSLVATLTPSGTHTSQPAAKRDDVCQNGLAYALDLHDALDVNFAGLSLLPLQKWDKLSAATGCTGIVTPASNDAASGAASETTPTTRRSLPVKILARQNSNGTTTTVNSTQTTNSTDASSSVYGYLNATDTANGGIDGSESTAENATIAENQALQANETAEGITYANIFDTTGKYVLNTDSYGNFVLEDSSNDSEAVEFEFVDNVVDADVLGDVFFYYPDEMTALGVSRFRIGDDTSIPLTAEIMSMVPINTDSSDLTPSILLPIDTSENPYYMVVCNIDDQASKIFLVNDYDSGINTLLQENMQYVITGGTVSACAPFSFASTFSGY